MVSCRDAAIAFSGLLTLTWVPEQSWGGRTLSCPYVVTVRAPRTTVASRGTLAPIDGPRGGQVHGSCFIRDTECATRVSLRFGRIIVQTGENSFVQARNPSSTRRHAIALVIPALAAWSPLSPA